MLKARLIELSVVAVHVLIAALAVVIGVQLSVWLGLTVWVAAVLVLTSLFYNYDAWLVRLLTRPDDPLMLLLCESGFVGRSRRLIGKLPSDPRCRLCLVPFGGLGRLLRIKPAAKNPNFCRSCFEGLPLYSHEVRVGILFADIRGFTAWSEHREPSEVAEALSRFYRIANRVLTKDDGLVEFVGDEVMALYSTAMPSLAERAPEIMLAAARRLVTTVRDEPEVLPIGVGLNIGMGRVGNFEKGTARDLTAVGDVVNTAKRLQSAAGAYEIVMAADFYEALADGRPDARATTFEAKGKAEPLAAFVLPAP